MHIDYGDCFGAAEERAKFPEKIPFRLTAMTEAALDVCGRNGAF